MIDVHLLLPPGKKRFDLPAEGENEGDLFGRQIGAIGDDPVDFAACFEADQKERMAHAMGVIAELHLGKEEDIRVGGNGAPFEDLVLGILADAGHEVFALVDLRIKALVVDVAAIDDAGFALF